MSGGCRRCTFCGPESLPDGASRRELGECEGGGLRGIDKTMFESYVACTNCTRIFGISCINSIHEAVREAYDAVQPPDEVDDKQGVWAELCVACNPRRGAAHRHEVAVAHDHRALLRVRVVRHQGA